MKLPSVAAAFVVEEAFVVEVAFVVKKEKVACSPGAGDITSALCVGGWGRIGFCDGTFMRTYDVCILSPQIC